MSQTNSQTAAEDLAAQVEQTLSGLRQAGKSDSLIGRRLAAHAQLLARRPDSVDHPRMLDQVARALRDARGELLTLGGSQTTAAVVRFPIERVADVERFLSKRELAQILGLSTSWIDKAIAERGLPSVKVGGVRRFRWSEVSEWLEAAQDR